MIRNNTTIIPLYRNFKAYFKQDYYKNYRIQDRVKRVFLGTSRKKGLLVALFIYAMLTSIGFVYLYPLLYMLVTSFKSLTDLLDTSVIWIPTALTLENYVLALEVMRFQETVINTLIISFVPAILQTMVTALTGYAFARYRIPGKSLLMILVLLTFIIPPHVLLVPTFLMFTDYNLIGTLGVLIYPAILGQGLRSAIFIVIFTQFFKKIPISLDEAARVDGAGDFRIFLSIALPSAVPALIVSFIFSFVWYWNETYFAAIFLGDHRIGVEQTISTLLLELRRFEESFRLHAQAASGTWGAGFSRESIVNEAIEMAGTMITILPVLIFYFFLQRFFIESIDKTGITGE